MKTNDHQHKNTPNDPSSKISTTCNHKIDLLLRRQNCQLPSIQCKEKCSHKHMKRQEYEQHQYSTEIELRKFMTNKIEHKNKPFMMEKECIKEEILTQINNAEQLLKNIKENFIKQIDNLYYGAVKSGNDELTAKGMDKFFSSQLDSLTCHQVYCLFSFKPFIQEKFNSKISSGLKFVKQHVTDITKSIENSKTSITEMINMIQAGQQSQMIPQKETSTQKKNIDEQKPQENKNIQKMDQEVQQKKGLEKSITFNVIISPTPKQPIQPQKAQSKPVQKSQVLPIKQEKQFKKDDQKTRKAENQIVSEQKTVKKDQEYPRKEQTQSSKEQNKIRMSQKQIINDEKYLRKEEKVESKQNQQIRIEEKIVRKQEKSITLPQKQQIQQKKTIPAQLPKPVEKQSEISNLISRQTDKQQKSFPPNSQTKNQIPPVPQDKSSKPQAIQKTTDKPMVNQVQNSPIKENTFKPSEYAKYTQRMSDNNALLEKYKMFQNYSEQTSKTKESSDMKKNTNESTKPINQKQVPQKPKITQDDQQFKLLFNDFKTLGSLDKMFVNNNNIKQIPKIIQKPENPISKPVAQSNLSSSQLTINKKQQLIFKKETKVVTDEQSIQKNIFTDFKRTSESFREKWNNQDHPEVRKIFKTGNQFPHSVSKTESPIMKKPSNHESKMIPEPETLPEKKVTEMNKTKQFLQLNSETKFPIPNGTSQTKKIDTTEPKQKPIEKSPARKEQSRSQPILTGSDKLLLELVRQSSQTQIQQPKSTKMDLELNNQSSVEEKQTPTFKITNYDQNLDKLNLDNPAKQTKKQFQTPEKPKQEVKNHQGCSNGVLIEPKKVDQKEQNQNPISFLPKPSFKKVQQQNIQAASPQKPVVQRQPTPIQTFDSGAKKIRLQNPGSRPFGRVSHNPIYNFVELFQRGQQGLKQLQQKKQEKRQEYNRNSLLGEMEKGNCNSTNYGLEGLKQSNGASKQQSNAGEVKSSGSNTNQQDSSKPIGLDKNKSSQKKLNYNGNYYDSRLPSWITQRK